MVESWLKDVAETAAVTLDVLDKKAERRGTVTHADETVQTLCMGYLYLLNLCDQQGILERRDIETLTDIIKKHTAIH
tara:strand:- start:833 stop:1063 length:231 start_codon:yes stop_codon:yes gene_type:complete